MYRVELKAYLFLNDLLQTCLHKVPNVPCGVERICMSGMQVSTKTLFLMYRVELKESWLNFFIKNCLTLFLMYRVELKVSSANLA